MFTHKLFLHVIVDELQYMIEFFVVDDETGIHFMTMEHGHHCFKKWSIPRHHLRQCWFIAAWNLMEELYVYFDTITHISVTKMHFKNRLKDSAIFV